MKLDERGLLIVISGPSGVGKGTVRSALFQREGHNLVYSVSMTTRAPREGEVDGREYYFVTRDEFENRIRNNGFLEYAEFVGNYYGTPLDMQVRKKMKDAVFIFIAPPKMSDLKQRLIRRATEPEDVIQSRYEKACKEIELAYMYDYIVVNDTVENAADKIMAIIRAEHAKTRRTITEYMKMVEDR